MSRFNTSSICGVCCVTLITTENNSDQSPDVELFFFLFLSRMNEWKLSIFWQFYSFKIPLSFENILFAIFLLPFFFNHFACITLFFCVWNCHIYQLECPWTPQKVTPSDSLFSLCELHSLQFWAWTLYGLISSTCCSFTGFS